jgi:hypothetical protein
MGRGFFDSQFSIIYFAFNECALSVAGGGRATFVARATESVAILAKIAL